MKKNIKLVYGGLIITIISAGLVFVLQNKINNSSTQDFNLPKIAGNQTSIESKYQKYFGMNKNIDYLTYGKTYKVVWTEDVYDSKYKVNFPRLKIDTEFINKAPENIKALLALYGYSFGNECDWDGKYTDQRDNLKCTLNTALGVGYQCSSTQFALLDKYFSADEIAGCSTEPWGSTLQSSLIEINITQNDKETFTVLYKFADINVRESSYVEEDKIDKFSFIGESFIRIK